MAHDKELESKPKHIVRKMGIEGPDEFVCTHRSHDGGRYVMHGDIEVYEKHMASHGKKQLGAKPCNRCGKEANLDLQPEFYNMKPMCQECQDYMINLWRSEGRIK